MNEEALKKKLEWVKAANREDLEVIWENIFETLPAPRCSMILLRGNITHHYQEAFYGSLSESTKQRLRNLYKQFKKNPDYVPEGKPPTMRPGTKLIRQYHGRTYETVALEDGFAFEGKRYRSLSQIATEITGTQWNGKKFFIIK